MVRSGGASVHHPGCANPHQVRVAAALVLVLSSLCLVVPGGVEARRWQRIAGVRRAPTSPAAVLRLNSSCCLMSYPIVPAVASTKGETLQFLAGQIHRCATPNQGHSLPLPPLSQLVLNFFPPLCDERSLSCPAMSSNVRVRQT